jgi:soluble lytic murein transglycosylase
MRPVPAALAVCLAALLAGAPAFANTEEPARAPDAAPAVEGFGTLAQRTLPPLLEPAQRETMRKAFTALRAGRWDEAHTLAAAVPLGAKVVRWIDMQRGAYGFDAVADFMEQNPSWPLQDTLMRRAEEAIAASGDDMRVRRWFGDRTPLTGSGALRLAEAFERTGERDQAARLVRTAWRDMNLGERIEQEMTQRLGHHLTAADRWARVDRLIWERRFADALRVMSGVDAGRRTLAEARMKLARETSDATAAVKTVPAALARDPGLAFERARFNRRTGFEDEALAIHRQAQAPYGRPEIWWREREFFTRRLLRDGRDADALALVSRHGLGPEHGQAFAEAQFLTGWIALRRAEDPKRALASFVALHENARFPVTLARAAYWAGRASEAAGDAEQARDWYLKASGYSVAYYGQLAQLRLPADARPTAAGAPTPSREERAKIERSELARAARLLADAEEHDRVKHFVRRMVDVAESPGQHRAVAQFAVGLGRPDLAVSAAKRSAQRAGVMLPDEGWPTINTPQVATPERALVLATIRQESAFEADAVSHAGARGLMQLMPQTARGVADKLGRRDHTTLRLTADPHYNMTLGGTYLAGLLETYNGSYLLALAAYNAGPGRAAQWIRDNGDPRASNVDPIDWVEMITIEETRNYVQRVLENVQVYRRKFGQKNWVAQLERDLGGVRR